MVAVGGCGKLLSTEPLTADCLHRQDAASIPSSSAFPFASRKTIWLPQLLPPGTILLPKKREDQRNDPPDVAASPPPAQQGSPKAVASGPDPDTGCGPCPVLGQCTVHEDGSHLKGTREHFGPTDVPEAKQVQNLCLWLAAPATADSSHQAPERQEAKERLGVETPLC